DTIVYHFLDDGTHDEQLDVTWQVSAVFEEGIGTPSLGAFDGLIETSYLEPPPFGGFDLARFTPTAIGNRWEYRWTKVVTVDDDDSTSSGYESFEVLPDTTIGDETFTVVHIQRFDDQRNLIESRICGYATDERLRLDEADDDARCELLYVLYQTDAHVDF